LKGLTTNENNKRDDFFTKTFFLDHS